MAKRIKMLLYGEPGVGKSVFASKAPKPFFICTDGNYEWLDEFGADPDAHINVSSWSEIKKVFESDLSKYETIVVDLLEDAFKWCEQEYCERNRIEHVSDVGYGKAYDATRNDFFIAISKLLSLDKHVILICHGITFTVKDRRGVEHTRYAPSSRIPDKVLDMIEGRVRYCLRCYVAAEEQPDGKIVKRRFLSLVPKENEFGIIRGVDENVIPHDIPLEFSEFAKAIKLDTTKVETKTATEVKPEPKAETKVESNVEAASKSEPVMSMKDKLAALKAKKEAAETQPEVKNEPKDEVKPEQVEVKVSEDAPFAESLKPEEQKPEVKETVNVATNDKLAAIRAKLAAMKAASNK